MLRTTAFDPMQAKYHQTARVAARAYLERCHCDQKQLIPLLTCGEAEPSRPGRRLPRALVPVLLFVGGFVAAALQFNQVRLGPVNPSL
jgi:hypothetical protein